MADCLQQCVLIITITAAVSIQGVTGPMECHANNSRSDLYRVTSVNESMLLVLHVGRAFDIFDLAIHFNTIKIHHCYGLENMHER